MSTNSRATVANSKLTRGAPEASGQATANKAHPPLPPANKAPKPESSQTHKPQPSAPAVTTRKAVPPLAIRNSSSPDITTDLIDEPWEFDSSPEGSERFSHVDGPLPVKQPTALIGRYALFDQFAEGGIATVHFGRIDGAGGFTRVVAIKRLLAHLVTNDEFTEMLLKEARFAARVRHPNVVPTLDVVASQGDVLLVLEYIHGESLSSLCRTQAKSRKDHIPVEIAAAVMLDVLSGLSAVHEATDEKGRALGLVHRDISPPNVVVGVDGYARVLDFGIAKALEHIEESMPNRLKGKIGYMSPEQIRGEGVSQRSDVFAAGVILWEVLATRRLFESGNESDRMKQIVGGKYVALSQIRPTIPKALEQVTMKALSLDPAERYANAREFAEALEHAQARASARKVAEWVTDLANDTLADRSRMIAQVENWNAGSEIPLHSSAFAAEAAQAFRSTKPPSVVNRDTSNATNAAIGSAAAPATTSAAPASSKPSRNPSWLLIASAVILLIALYYTVWK